MRGPARKRRGRSAGRVKSEMEMGTLGWFFSSQTVVQSRMCRDAGMVIAQQRAHGASGDVLSCASDMLICAAPWG